MRSKERRSVPAIDGAYSFGRFVLGPIVAHFCLRIWLYAKGAEAADSAVLLFCARGGVGIREAFERLLLRLSLPLDMRRENVMISRLVAADKSLWPIVEDRMNELFARVESDQQRNEAPEFLRTYAKQQFQKRLTRIKRALDQSPEQLEQATDIEEEAAEA